MRTSGRSPTASTPDGSWAGTRPGRVPGGLEGGEAEADRGSQDQAVAGVLVGEPAGQQGQGDEFGGPSISPTPMK
jgi:hypothetical protein